MDNIELHNDLIIRDYKEADYDEIVNSGFDRYGQSGERVILKRQSKEPLN